MLNLSLTYSNIICSIDAEFLSSGLLQRHAELRLALGRLKRQKVAVFGVILRDLLHVPGAAAAVRRRHRDGQSAPRAQPALAQEPEDAAQQQRPRGQPREVPLGQVGLVLPAAEEQDRHRDQRRDRPRKRPRRRRKRQQLRRGTIQAGFTQSYTLFRLIALIVTYFREFGEEEGAKAAEGSKRGATPSGISGVGKGGNGGGGAAAAAKLRASSFSSSQESSAPSDAGGGGAKGGSGGGGGGHGSGSGSSSGSGSMTHHRYYHVFREGELDFLINKYVENLHIVNSYYDHANWCVVAEKVNVWTI